MGLPMVIQLIMFVFWSNFVLPNIVLKDKLIEEMDLVCRTGLTITAIYLLSLEISSIV